MLRRCCQDSLTPLQDGYTLERVDVYGLVDGVHETVVIPGAECYVGRNDNPSFSPCGSFFSLLRPGLLNLSVSHCPPLPGTIKKTIKKICTFLDSSWLGAAQRAYGNHLACRRPVGPEQGTLRCCALSGLVLLRPDALALTMTARWQEYVYNLAAAVRSLAPEAHDSHLFALEVR